MLHMMNPYPMPAEDYKAFIADPHTRRKIERVCIQLLQFGDEKSARQRIQQLIENSSSKAMPVRAVFSLAAASMNDWFWLGVRDHLPHLDRFMSLGPPENRAKCAVLAVEIAAQFKVPLRTAMLNIDEQTLQDYVNEKVADAKIGHGAEEYALCKSIRDVFKDVLKLACL